MRFRFTIAGLLALVAACGVAVAALRYADELVASLAFSSAILAFGIASLGAAFRHGRPRALWAGFAAFGLGYLALCYGPFASTEIRPHLATTKLLDYLGPRVNRTSQGEQNVLGYFEYVEDADEFVEDAGDGRITTSMDGSSMVVSALAPPTLVASATPEFKRVGHSLFALLLAVFGGLIARFFAARAEGEATPSPPTS